jgi:hypothetical protein
MKAIIKLFAILIILVLAVSCSILKKKPVDTRTVILPLGDTIHVTDGSVVYGLPLTVFDIAVEIEKKEEKAGPYSKYASDMLGIREPIVKDQETWTIKSVKIHSHEELDPSEFYIIESNTLVQTNVLSLKKAGLILDLNPDSFNGDGSNGSDETMKDGNRGFLDMGADEYFVVQSDTAYRLVKLDTAFIKIPYLIEKKKQLGVDQLAEKAAKTLLEFRDGKHLILTGEANVYPQDKSAIDETNRLENEYLALFAGKTWSEFKTLHFTVVPQKDTEGQPVTLFRISEKSGISDAAGKTGIAVTVDCFPVKKMKDLTVIGKPKGQGESVEKFDRLFYRVPEIVTVNIKSGKDIIYSSRKMVYQLGQIVQLPANYIIGK